MPECGCVYVCVGVCASVDVRLCTVCLSMFVIRGQEFGCTVHEAYVYSQYAGDEEEVIVILVVRTVIHRFCVSGNGSSAF